MLYFDKIKRYLLIILYVVIGFVFNFLFISICKMKYNFIEMVFRTFLAILLSCMVYWILGKANNFLEKYYVKILIAFLMIMFSIQVVCGYFLEITPKWDFYNVYQGAVDWAETGSFSDFNRYYYMYPNNLGSMALFTLLFKLVGLFGIDDYYMVATTFNAMLNILMMLVVFLICKKLLSVKSGIFSLYIFAVSLPSYFGASVFYTDVLTMLFPVLFYFLYLKFREEADVKKQIFWAVLMGLDAFIGMKLKLTVLIVVIAVCIELIINFNIKRTCIAVCVVSIVVFAGNTCFNEVIYNGHLDKEIAEEKNFPVTHWIMMGLQGDGGFDQNDENFSNSFTKAKDRNKAIRQRIKIRMNNLGSKGLFNLAVKKAVKCFGVGTYELSAFFYHGMVRNTILNQYVVANGKYYGKYRLFCTGIYLCFFVLMVFGIFYNVYSLISKKEDMVYNIVPALSVFGLFLFLIMWETAARYITNYIPMIYIGAVSGMADLGNLLRLKTVTR